MAYGVGAAVNSGLFQAVVVSTDDPEIGRVAEWYGAEYLERPADMASDTAPSIDATIHVLRSLAGRGVQPERFCQIFPNCPLVTSADICELWQQFVDMNRSFQISAVTYRCVHPEWAMVVDEQQRGSWRFGDYLVRSQDLARTFCPTGAVWFAKTKDLLEQGTFYGKPYHLAPIDANRGVDIDDNDDWKLAELLVHGLMAREGASPLEPLKQSYLEGGRR